MKNFTHLDFMVLTQLFKVFLAFGYYTKVKILIKICHTLGLLHDLCFAVSSVFYRVVCQGTRSNIREVLLIPRVVLEMVFFEAHACGLFNDR